MNEVYDVFIVDGIYYPVPTKVTDWVNQYPENINEYEEIPLFVRELYVQDVYEKMVKRYSDKVDHVMVTSGSWDNDKVLAIILFLPSFEDMGYVREWLNENNFKLGSKLEYLSY